MELLVACAALLCCALVLSWGSGWRVRAAAIALAVLGAYPLARYGTHLIRGDIERAKLAFFRPEDRTLQDGSAYASSRACRSCHPSEYATWKASYHRTMTQPANEESILAPWEGTIEHQGRSYRLLRKGKTFYVDMPKYGTNGKLPSERMLRPVVMTTGSHHQQLYWLPLPWADKRPIAGGAEAYVKRCGTCHGNEGYGGQAAPLYGAEMLMSAIVDAIDTPAHVKAVGAPLGGDREPILDHMQRLQLTGRLLQFPFAYFIRERRFVHEDDTFLQPPPKKYPVEPYEEGWSDSCDQCHAVAPQYAAPNGAELGRARVAELGIGCESCHGPAARHVSYHRNPLNRYDAHLRERPPDDVVLPTRLDKRRSAAVCARCHSESVDRGDHRLVPDFKPGDLIEKYVHVVQRQEPPYPKWLQRALKDEDDLLRSGFWRDGTIRIAGRDYNGMVKSPCHQKGELTCTTCHQMHGSDPNDQLKAEAEGNEVCADCHRDITADVSAHSHHPADSAGSLCYNCHMPRTTIGLMNVMRAHRIDVPSPLGSAETGRPNACNLCHVDRSLSAMAQAMERWYGTPDATGATLSGDEVSATLTWLLEGDAAQRMVAAWHLGWKDAQQASGAWWMAPFLAELLDDPYSEVRYTAGRSLMTLPGYAELGYDYVADADALAAISKRARQAWPAKQVRDKTRPSLLIWGGAIDDQRLAAMIAERDDTPVSVNE